MLKKLYQNTKAVIVDAANTIKSAVEVATDKVVNWVKYLFD